MKNILKVTIRNRDFKKSTGYGSAQSCPLATALKRKIPNEVMLVGKRDVTVMKRPGSFKSKGMYKISKNWAKVRESEVDDIIITAKSGVKQKKVKVLLTLK